MKPEYAEKTTPAAADGREEGNDFDVSSSQGTAANRTRSAVGGGIRQAQGLGKNRDHDPLFAGRHADNPSRSTETKGAVIKRQQVKVVPDQDARGGW
jgi:hypothetical protein